jgi:hypothetical protein
MNKVIQLTLRKFKCRAELVIQEVEFNLKIFVLYLIKTNIVLHY